MANELLAVPEEFLAEVILVIRAGLRDRADTVLPTVRENLNRWCDEEEAYLAGRVPGEPKGGDG